MTGTDSFPLVSNLFFTGPHRQSMAYLAETTELCEPGNTWSDVGLQARERIGDVR